MDKITIKQLAQRALKRTYGYAPSLKEIVLLESGINKGDIDYILFSIGDYEYRYSNCYITKLN